VTGLIHDHTYQFKANVIITGCGGGACSGSKDGSTLSFKTNADAATCTTPVLTPAATSIGVTVTFTPNTNTSTATFIIEYKRSIDPGYTTWVSYTGLSGTTGLAKSTTITGLTPATGYDVRGRWTRTTNNGTSGTSTVASTTTLASEITSTSTEAPTTTDAVALLITGFAVQGDEETGTGLEEEIELLLVSSRNEELVGVWFYHLPTKSYWLWSLDGLTALVSDTNADNQNRVWAALGADVYYLDDDTYQYDDHDQSRPLNTDGKFEVPLSFSPKALDGLGAYLVAQAIDIKLGSTLNVDPYGKMDIDQTTDIYIGPEARHLLDTREVDLAPASDGYNEWRSYSLPKVQAANVVGLRFTFSQGESPLRKHPVEVEQLRVILGKTPLRQRRT
jgi:hypothetical protein